MELKTIVILVLAAVILLSIPLLISGGKHEAAKPAKPTEAVPEAAPPARDPNAPLITKAVYEALRTGITYDQAVDAIGVAESEAHSEYSRGVPGFTSPSVTGWYTWTNPDGSFASLGFVNNLLAEKKEEGLK